MLGENLEEGDGVFGALDITGDVQANVALPPLSPGCGKFLEECRRKTLVELLMCIMEVICRLHLVERGSILKGLLWVNSFGSGRRTADWRDE